MITLIFVFMAAACNAVMDNISHHWYKSVFSDLNPKFWCPDVSWEYAKKIFGWKYDAWHIFKSLMIIMLAFAIVFYKPIVNTWVSFFLIGLVWNNSFNLFYNALLNK